MIFKVVIKSPRGLFISDPLNSEDKELGIVIKGLLHDTFVKNKGMNLYKKGTPHYFPTALLNLSIISFSEIQEKPK